jgi:hypothetical protein
MLLPTRMEKGRDYTAFLRNAFLMMLHTSLALSLMLIFLQISVAVKLTKGTAYSHKHFLVFLLKYPRQLRIHNTI